MTIIHSPDEIREWGMIRPIDRAIILREYRKQVEKELTRAKALFDETCRLAKESGELETDEYRLQIRYASGVSKNVDTDALLAFYPEAYQRLRDEQLKKWNPKGTKTDLEWLFPDKEERKEAEAKILVEHLVDPQYVLVEKKKEVSEDE